MHTDCVSAIWYYENVFTLRFQCRSRAAAAAATATAIARIIFCYPCCCQLPTAVAIFCIVLCPTSTHTHTAPRNAYCIFWISLAHTQTYLYRALPNRITITLNEMKDTGRILGGFEWNDFFPIWRVCVCDEGDRCIVYVRIYALLTVRTGTDTHTHYTTHSTFVRNTARTYNTHNGRLSLMPTMFKVQYGMYCTFFFWGRAHTTKCCCIVRPLAFATHELNIFAPFHIPIK